MSSRVHVARAYRSVLREIGRTAIQPRLNRNAAILTMLRTMVSDPQVTSQPTFEKQMNDMAEFLKSGRIYGELLLRYNPTHDMTTEEKVKATARRVGLEDVKSYVEQQQAEELKALSEGKTPKDEN